jgi:hypothetical protein
MAQPAKGVLDDSYTKLVLMDFSGGVNLYKGALALGTNESPEMWNVIPFPGRLQYRGGWTPTCTLPGEADQAYAFYDTIGAKRWVVWTGGDLYDVTSGVPILIEAGAYTAGERVGVVDLNGIMYWSTWTTPIRYWDAQTSTAAAVVASGPSPVPASPLLMLYTNAIVAFGVKFGAFPRQPNVFSWSNINDPTFWDASNSQAVGPNNGAELSFALVFGIAEIGVAPFRTFLTARTDHGLYAYQGALGTLAESVINLPTGCAHGESAQYLPSMGDNGTIVFLGNDAQFWATNGIVAKPVSLNILPLLQSQANLAAVNNPNSKAWGGYNQAWQYYFCDIDGIQFVYKWDTGAWTLFTGWPSGPVVQSTNVNGAPSLFIASGNGLGTQYWSQIGLGGVDDNGNTPRISWTSPFLHMGNPEKLKIFDWVSMVSYNTATTYKVDARSLSRANGEWQQAETLYFSNALPGTGNPFILDLSLLDGPGLLVQPPVLAPPVSPVMNHGRISVPVAVDVNDPWLHGITGMSEQMASPAVQFTVAYDSGTLDYELLALEVRFLDRGYLREGGNQFSGQAGVVGRNIFVPNSENPS